ncbi:FkbM family methyltransferase [Phormidium sp. LEGE 05292]|uniref:FkbM family methyltransferase n=1 Tax=[Phormidium] sp. LEGE 05292 TaxID=767427 RepID=UPI0018814127|nr:FkbM family methyltransferase [Phormidium sp. LEGE 05292]MBE9226770.1 FkbM family methyltransferase [Phormidium sp. LEGE 05292]
MKQIWLFIVSNIYRSIVKIISLLTGRGAGKFATILPKGQRYLVKNYCGLYNFYVDTTYPIEASIWLGGVYDIVTTNFLHKVIRPGDVFLDVGANCGALTLVAASVISDGKIYAFEPGVTIRSRLQANIDVNPQLKDCIEVVPLGLGLTKSQLFYHEDENYRGNGSLHISYGVPVEIISLDEWVLQENISRIDVIKIDVEGMEYDVLLGGKATLEKFRPLIYFETLELFYSDKQHKIRDIYEFLANFEYKIVRPTSPHLEVSFASPYPANSVAVPASKLERLKIKSASFNDNLKTHG